MVSTVGKLISAADAISELSAAGANMPCKRLTEILENFGFAVERCRTPSHYTVSHRGLSEFHGSDFACEHGKSPQVKRGYIKNMKRVIERYAQELDAINS